MYKKKRKKKKTKSKQAMKNVRTWKSLQSFKFSIGTYVNDKILAYIYCDHLILVDWPKHHLIPLYNYVINVLYKLSCQIKLNKTDVKHVSICSMLHLHFRHFNVILSNFHKWRKLNIQERIQSVTSLCLNTKSSNSLCCLKKFFMVYKCIKLLLYSFYS